MFGSRGGGCGDQDLPFGPSAFELVNKGDCGLDFSHGDGVNPDGAAWDGKRDPSEPFFPAMEALPGPQALDQESSEEGGGKAEQQSIICGGKELVRFHGIGL